jgi:uncharacterized membrane protein YecN with MAPEG domain
MLRPYEKKAILWAAILAAPAYILYCIFVHGVPVPYMDQWELVPLLQKMHAHQLQFADLWAQHNEHRIFAPRIVMLLLARLSGWNIWWEFITGFAIAGGTLALLYSMLKRAFPDRVPGWLLITFSLVVFSPIQAENWLWGWQIQIFMNVIGVVIAVWALDRWPDRLRGVLVAIGGAFLATYSFSNGLFCWIAIAPVFLMRKPRQWAYLALWSIAAAAAIGLYLWHYVEPVNHPPARLFLQHPWQWLLYALLYIGGPLPLGTKAIALIGAGVMVLAIGVAMLVLLLRQGRTKLTVLAPWLALAAYVLISALVTGVGRIGFGPSQALSSRYTTFASLSVLSILVIVGLWIAGSRQPRGSLPLRVKMSISLLAIVFAYAYVRSVTTADAYMAYMEQQRRAGMVALRSLPNTPDEALFLLYPHPDMVRERARILSELGIILPPPSAASKPHN